MEKAKPITMPGVHSRFLKFFKEKSEPTHLKILDMGAGHGAFSVKLYELDYEVHACDLFPELFEFDKIECKKVDLTKSFPYPDNFFDIVIAIEVSEHILDHETFFSETSRILKPEGKLYLSTPNMLSLKSRMRFLFTGFFYSFDPLELNNYNGMQHVASLTLDQYNYLAVKYHFKTAEVNIDKKQSTSQWIMFLLFPFMFISQKIKKSDTKHNTGKLMLGRLLFLTFQNDKQK